MQLQVCFLLYPLRQILDLECRIGKVSIHEAVIPYTKLMAYVGLPVMAITGFVSELSLFCLFLNY